MSIFYQSLVLIPNQRVSLIQYLVEAICEPIHKIKVTVMLQRDYVNMVVIKSHQSRSVCGFDGILKGVVSE
jgi:hypothetical protein